MTAEFLDDDMKMKIEKDASLFLPKPVELDDMRNFVCKELGLSDESMEKEDKSRTTQDKYNEKENALNKGRRQYERRKNERRRYERSSCKKIIQCSLSTSNDLEMNSELKTSIVNISKEGACITANYPLYPGNILKFDISLGNRSGIIQWGKKDAGSFRAGIRFL